MITKLRSKAERLASLFPPLSVEAERVAETIWQGTHGRRRAGIGESFWQFRHYEPGDASQRIDWRQSARTDKLFIRQKEWEASQTVYLWADSSGSMRFSSSRNIPQKIERARVMALALASLLLRGDEKVVWLDERRQIAVHGRLGLAYLVERLGEALGSSVPPSFEFSHSSTMVLASDFLMDTNALLDTLSQAKAKNVKGVLIHIFDPAELEFRVEGRVKISGLEDEPSLLLANATQLHEAYQTRLQDHKLLIKNYAENAGWYYVPHLTSALPHHDLINIYQYLI